MANISEELKLIVTLLSLRFPIAELTEGTGYSKGTISNYLNNKQAPSKKFLNKVKESYSDSFETFEFRKRLRDAIEHYNEVNQIDIEAFAKHIGWEIPADFQYDDILELNRDDVVLLTSKISFVIKDFINYVNNQSRSDVKGISLKKLTKLERTVFLKKDELSEEDMILFIKVMRKHRDSLLEFDMFKKLVKSLAFTLEIEDEIENFLNSA